jgi:hypothetical protein
MTRDEEKLNSRLREIEVELVDERWCLRRLRKKNVAGDADAAWQFDHIRWNTIRLIREKNDLLQQLARPTGG